MDISDSNLKLTVQERRQLMHTLRRAMLDSDQWVVRFAYVDKAGVRTVRVVSPIRVCGQDRFLGLCLCREEPRQFYFDRCSDVTLVPACEVLMPMQLETVA